MTWTTGGTRRGPILTGMLTTLLAAGTGMAEGGDCCSCAVEGRETFASPQLPCLFDHPAGWDVQVGDDGALVSAVAGPDPCGKTCPNGQPGLSLSFGTKPDSNADTMQEIWQQVMPVVGTADCGDAKITFFSPPGSDETGLMGGVKFYVSVGGRKYSAAANFTCGEAGGWLALRRQFIDSFRDNPESRFGAD